MKEQHTISYLKDALFGLLDPYYSHGSFNKALQALRLVGYGNIAQQIRRPRYTQESLTHMYMIHGDKIGKIGIGITTHNRRERFNETYGHILSNSPDCKIVVVDDASDIPCEKATYRFDENVGIAAAKNKCLELLSDCDHIFLFDDDCYPKLTFWYMPYVLSGINHMMYLFDQKRYKFDKPIYKRFVLDDTYSVHSHAKGCMLYYTKEAIEKAGVMYTGFGRWGGEHTDLSDRIFFSGLTPFPYMDLEYSYDLIYSADEYDATPRTVNGQEFWDCFNKTQEMYLERANNRTSTLGYGEGDLVVAHILTSMPDPQRGTQWPKDIGVAQKLVDSVLENSGADILIFTDFYEGDFGRVKYVKYPDGMSPLFYKLFITYDYLRRSKKYKNIFIVDSNDVEMLHNPFPHIKDLTLYVGRDVPCIIKDYDWMINSSGTSTVNFWARQADFPMVNAGVIGGRADMVMHFLRLFIFWYMKYKGDVGERNMPLCNYIFWDKWRYKLEYGKHVTTRFKAYERTNAWWKHK